MSDKQFKVETGLHVEGGNTDIMGAADIRENLRVRGSLQVDGSIVYDMQGTADFLPTANGYSLGSSTKRWHAELANVTISGNTSLQSILFTAASTAARASLRVPHGTAPSTPGNGDTWSTNAGLFFRLNGASKTIAFTDSNITGSANNTAFFGGQEPSYYLNLSNTTGNLTNSHFNSATVYGIDIAGNANNSTNLNGQNAAYYLNAANLTGTVPAARLSGTYGISVNTANNATNLGGQAPAYYTDVTARLGYTPVQQGTGVGQSSTDVKIGWNTTATKLQVTVGADNNLGSVVFETDLSSAAVASALQANNATHLNGQTASYYLAGANITGTVANATNSTNLNGQNAAYYLNAANLTGTVASARLSGTYNISINGNANTATSATNADNATNLNGQNAAYYLNAANLTGTINNARLPSTMTGKSFSSAVSVTGALNSSTFTTGNAVVDYLTVQPQNSSTEGGEIKLTGAGSFRDIAIDNNGGILRIFALSGSGYPVYEFNASNLLVGGNGVWHGGNFNPNSYLLTSGTAANSNQLNGQAGSYYLNASNFNAGTLPAARLSGTYSINVSQLGGLSESAFMRRAVDSWITSADGVNRFYFSNGSSTYITGTNTVIFQMGGADRVAINSGGMIINQGLTVGGGATLGSLHVTGAITSAGDITAFNSSDIRLKKDIVRIPNALDKVKAIGGYLYTRKETDKREVGVIAQEIQKILPEMVQERTDGTLAVQYERLTALLIEAIKEIADSQPK